MRYLIVIGFVFFGFTVFGQSKDEIIQERVEFIAQDLDATDIPMEDIFEVLGNYYDNPLNLNVASKSDMQKLLMLNEFQINSLLKQRDENGPFKTLYELKDLQFWDLKTLQQIIPFVRVSKVEERKKSSFIEYLKEGEFEAYLRYQQDIERKAGYEPVSDSMKEASNKYFWGSPGKIYSRLRYTHGDQLDIGVTMEKDPGEEIFGKTQPYGFDFYSFHAYYGGGKYLRKAVIGDYEVQVGQGLAFWSGFGFSKTAQASSIKKDGHGLDSYTSSNESNYLRGAGVELGYNNFSLTMWGSYKRVDGTVNKYDTIDDELARLASSINISGYHRTTSELERKKSIKEMIYGAHLKYEIRSFEIGITAVKQGYDTYFQKSDQLREKYDFEGKNLVNLSANYSYIFRNISLFGEVAQSRDSKAVAFLQGLSIAMGSKATFSALYRYYPKDYHSFYAQGFGESSNTINESGLYIGGEVELAKDWDLNAYVDFFKSPWLSFRVDKPSNGYDFLSQLTYGPSSRMEAYLRVSQSNEMINVSDYETNIRPVERYKQWKYRLSYKTKIGGGWEWKSRIDYVTYDRPSEGFQEGYSITQNLLYRNKKFPLQVTLGFSVFNTDSYDTRSYVYEYNLQNVFSIPVYYGRGSRGYLLFRYTFWKGKCDLWLRYGIYVYDQKGTIGSGSSEIQGNVKSDIGAQFRIRL